MVMIPDKFIFKGEE